MGIPKFNRFLCNRYPSIQEPIKDGSVIECDNLFVDMNGIIHLCSHPEEEKGISEKEYTTQHMYENIFNFVDVLFDVVKPKKLLFLAIDGVAPRAKLNQQRARRFKNAKERQLLNAQDSRNPSRPFARYDQNCITPGTKFMERLQIQLEYFISHRISTTPSWQKCKVILCGSQVPGEGEHKIMEYIRRMKADPDYSPFQRYYFYGMDADLVILGLCTREKNITILREGVNAAGKAIRAVRPVKENFTLIHLSLLREYLDMEFSSLKTVLTFHYTTEGVIDDWVLLGFMVGNDYLPHLADIHIDRGGLQLLMKTYIEVLPRLDGFINVDGHLNLQRFKVFMEKLAQNVKRNFRPKHHPYFDEKKDLAKRKNLNLEKLFSEYRRDYYRDKLRFRRKNFQRRCANLGKEYVRGLQWNLYYYYHGCKSWSWFYPGHYGPCATTIADFEAVSLSFPLGKPFLPFEQLLAVLPPRSKNLVPKCYRKLMISRKSPLKRYYPKDFKTDLNGKRNEWEAVVLLPMIDERQLIAAAEPFEDELREVEKRRNQYGDMLVYSYSEQRQAPVPATTYFPRINRNHASVVSQRLGTYPPLLTYRVVHRPRVDPSRPEIYFPGFPSFSHLEYTGEKMFWEVNVPRGSIRLERIIVIMKENEAEWKKEYALALLGKVAHVNWPHFTEARIVGLEDLKYKYLEHEGLLQKRGLQDDIKFRWTRSCCSLRNKYLAVGIEIGTVTCIAYVNLLIGTRTFCDSNGSVSLRPIWSEKTVPFPLQTIVDDLDVYDNQSEEGLVISELFPQGTEVFSLDYSTYGCRGQIQEIKDDPDNDSANYRFPVKLEIVDDRKIQREIMKYREPDYYTSRTVAKKLGITKAMVEKLAGSLEISVEREDSGTTEEVTLNIGLQISNAETFEKVPGYSKLEHQWMYSDRAVTVMEQYIEKFPEVIDFLSSLCTVRTSFSKYDYLPNLNDYLGFMRIVEWLQRLKCSRIKPVSCFSDFIEEDFVEMLTRSLDSISCEAKYEKLVFMKPKDLFADKLVVGNLAPVATSEYELLDRVAFTKRTGAVPAGTRGTIIGIISAENGEDVYDILLDKRHANEFNSNVPFVRVMRVAKTQFINITRGKRDIAFKEGFERFFLYEQCSLTMQSDLSSIFSMFMTKLGINYLMMKLMTNRREPEGALSTVSNSRIKKEQERLWNLYYSRMYNPCMLAIPLRLLRQCNDGSEYIHQYMLRKCQTNHSNKQKSDENSIFVMEDPHLYEDKTGTYNTLFGGRTIYLLPNLFPVEPQGFRLGAHIKRCISSLLGGSHNDNDQLGTVHEVFGTVAPNLMLVLFLLGNGTRLLLQPLLTEDRKGEGQASAGAVHASN